MRPQHEIIADALGRILGRVQARRPLNARERKYCEDFLKPFQRAHIGDSNNNNNPGFPILDCDINPNTNSNNNKEISNMAQQTKDSKARPVSQETVNLTFLAGEIMQMKVDDKRGWLALDCGIDKWVPCSIYADDDLLHKISQFAKGDFIQVKGFVRPWSRKKNDEWENGMDVRITEIRSAVPVPALGKTPEKPKAKAAQASYDDDHPF